MQVKLKLFRYNPEKDKKPHYDHFTVEAEPTDRVLDLLELLRITKMARLLTVALALTGFVDRVLCVSTVGTVWLVRAWYRTWALPSP
jgi:hypothetical protein